MRDRDIYISTGRPGGRAGMYKLRSSRRSNFIKASTGPTGRTTGRYACSNPDPVREGARWVTGFWYPMLRIVLPGRRSGFRAGFRQDFSRGSSKIGPPAGRRADFEAVPIRIRPKSGPEAQSPSQKHHCLTESTYPGEPRAGTLGGLGQ